ncbi:hypothetical protein GRI97_16155 [Altererythrobacter xixiisoli]|uniref:Lipoprotein n=1 Tax=Croceibacterium xixiisoli TaxID=1476466 RepID=A0A6I4U1H9_9SPHN|nr:hypothetical protein [Croceibacterium xixiisoli]MXP00524.1 hypothetical protein [Croceibacterium xixiisoli]
MLTFAKPLSPLLIGASLLLGACQPHGEGSSPIPGDLSDTRPFDAIAPDEAVHVLGTEPFWNGDIANATLLWKTPEDADGTATAVERFAGRGGLSFTGTLDGKPVVVMVTQGECSDGMSDRTFPFTATVSLGGAQLNGCAWTARHPYTGPEAP